MNLVSNAIRYTRRGGVLIGVRREGAGFRVDVVDTGIGIPQRAASRDLRGVPAARRRRRAARPRLRSGARDRRADRAHARASVARAVGAGPRLAVLALPCRRGSRGPALAPARARGRSRGAIRGRLAGGHRERGRHPRGHAGAAAGLGLCRAHRTLAGDRHRPVAPEPSAAGGADRGLPSRRLHRHRCHRHGARRLRRRPSRPW